MAQPTRVRSTIGIAALLIAGPMTGCDAQDSTEVIESVSEPSLSTSSSSPAGSAAAKGAELTAVATVRAWVSAYNQGVGTDELLTVDPRHAAQWRALEWRALDDRRCASDPADVRVGDRDCWDH